MQRQGLVWFSSACLAHSRRLRSCWPRSEFTVCWRLPFLTERRKLEYALPWVRNQATFSALVMREGFMLAAIGILFGVAVAYAAARSMQTLLAGVRPDDLVTFSAAIALALLMTIIGSFLPAMRAVRVDP